jgi:hypothetical protein
VTKHALVTAGANYIGSDGIVKFGPSGSESRGTRSQTAFNSSVMSPQIQWATALVW